MPEPAYTRLDVEERRFTATLEQKAAELASRVAPDPALAPAEQLATSLDAFLGWVEENGDAYAKLVRGARRSSPCRR